MKRNQIFNSIFLNIRAKTFSPKVIVKVKKPKRGNGE